MKPARPLSRISTSARASARREGAGVVTTGTQEAAAMSTGEDLRGGLSPCPWPVEMTEWGLQYVIPGCERRNPPRGSRR